MKLIITGSLGHISKPLTRELVDHLFQQRRNSKKSTPTVQYISDKLNVSFNYLTCLLKVLTGQSTQQHIHYKLIEKAKEKLSTTDLPVSEIAYKWGFEHPPLLILELCEKPGRYPE